MGSESEKAVKKAEYAIGIDLGTTYSCVGIWRSGKVDIIDEFGSGVKQIPSFVAFTEEYDEEKEEYVAERLVGEAAFNTDNFSATNTIFDSKRLIGRRFSEKTVQDDMNLWPFKVVPGKDDKAMISITCKGRGETKLFAPEEISAAILSKLKEMAEDFLGNEKIKVVVEDAVITVPAYFNQSQRQATREAGKKAGLNVLRLLNEPTAAAVTYSLYTLHDEDRKKEKKNVLVFDLGGGTFDVSCLIIKNNKIEVQAVAGDSHLGGQDFVHRMVKHFVEVYKRKHNKDISGDIAAMRALRRECERCKRSLSISQKTRTAIPRLCGNDFEEQITRAKFEELNSDLFDKCIEIVKKCLIDAKMDKKEIDEVVLVGGSSRIPKVQQLLYDFMNIPKGLYKSLDMGEAVAMGAAIQAALLSGRGSGDIEKLKLVDVTPLSLGTGVVGDVMEVLIPKNTPIPFRAVKGFTTSKDYQTSITSRVYEGERARASANKLLGELSLTDIKPELRGVATIDICFDLQEDGILEVSSKDIATGKEIKTTIQDVKLLCEEIRRMVKEAKENEASDEMLKKKKEAQTSFMSYICKLRNETTNEKKKDAIEEAFKWVDSKGGQLAEISEYEEKKKKLMSDMDA